ncbi:hypothetical protein BCR32DRAFT_91528 [Anaeromyces robustus]|uniref:Uncharacterized protein n=1 Tax=Anaeromyces robustus TaxID=1754192 RepID=A0A1Y1XI83_9FUNG|nr:hypothetical protein BCR32DRAFT_91528 [Anaeromyces robustus]|eukprot:ORX85469.1 hypothetical protein BCR32DRAFT_91528 [Anaeromyces robustus]
MPGAFLKFDNSINSKENIANINNNIDNIDKISITNNSELSVPFEEENDHSERIYKSNDIFENMDNIINDNVLDFTACRYCSSNLITL